MALVLIWTWFLMSLLTGSPGPGCGESDGVDGSLEASVALEGCSGSGFEDVESWQPRSHCGVGAAGAGSAPLA